MPCRVAVLLAAVLGLGQSKISGLQWQDVDCDNALVHLRRGIVNQQISELKTAGSKRAMPIRQVALRALEQWKAETDSANQKIGIFASEQTYGKQPLWFISLLTRHIRPAALRLGITKSIG